MNTLVDLPKVWDRCWVNVNLATLADHSYGIIPNAVLAIKDDRIA